MAFKTALLCLLVQQGLADLLQASDFVTQDQLQQLRQIARRSTLPDACPTDTTGASEVEQDFAHMASLKFFAFTNEVEAYPLDGLKECMETVADRTWLGGYSNLWEASKAQVEEFAKDMTKDQWTTYMVDGYLESTEMDVTNSVLDNPAVNTGPLQFFKHENESRHLHEPCNTLANTAFYMITIESCRLSEPANYAWNDVMKAVGHLMGFGSFAMHSNPFDGSSPPEDHEGRWSTVNTHQLDTAAMDIQFYMYYQAAVYAFAGEDTAGEDLQALLSQGGGNWDDPRETAKALFTTLTGSSHTWNDEIRATRQNMPNYRVSAVGLTMVAFYGIFNEELLGPIALELVPKICSVISSTLGISGEFCDGDGVFAQAARRIPWKVPRNMATGLEKVVQVLETFIEAMWFQERNAKPEGYLEQWKDMGLLQPVESECWKMPHGNWHKLGAITSLILQRALAVDIPELMVERPLSEDQKIAAFEDLTLVVPHLQRMYNTLMTLSKGDQVNLCNIYRIAQECEASDVPCPAPQVRSLLDPTVLNDLMNGLLQNYDNLENLVTQAGELEDPMGVCEYSYTAALNRVSGLGSFGLAELDVQTAYVPGESLSDSVVRVTVDFKTCPLPVKLEGNASILRQGDGWSCSEEQGELIVKASLLVALESKVSVDVNLDALASQNSETVFSTDLSQLNIRCFDLTLLPPTDGWHQQLSYATLNAGMDSGLSAAACSMITPTITAQVNQLLLSEAAKVGTKAQESFTRRVAAEDQVCKAVPELMLSLWSQEEYDKYLKDGWQDDVNDYMNDDDSVSISDASRMAAALSPLAVLLLQFAKAT